MFLFKYFRYLNIFRFLFIILVLHWLFFMVPCFCILSFFFPRVVQNIIYWVCAWRQLIAHNLGQKRHILVKTNSSHWDLVNFSEYHSKVHFWSRSLIVKLQVSLINLSICEFHEKIWENLTTIILEHLMTIWNQDIYSQVNLNLHIPPLTTGS